MYHTLFKFLWVGILLDWKQCSPFRKKQYPGQESLVSAWPLTCGKTRKRGSRGRLRASWMGGHWPGTVASFFPLVSWHGAPELGSGSLENYESMRHRLTLQITLAPSRPAVVMGPAVSISWLVTAGSLGSQVPFLAMALPCRVRWLCTVFGFVIGRDIFLSKVLRCLCLLTYSCYSQKPSIGRCKMELTHSMGTFGIRKIEASFLTKARSSI